MNADFKNWILGEDVKEEYRKNILDATEAEWIIVRRQVLVIATTTAIILTILHYI